MIEAISVTCKVDGVQHEAYLFDADVPLRSAKAHYPSTDASFKNASTGSGNESITPEMYRELLERFGIRI